MAKTRVLSAGIIPIYREEENLFLLLRSYSYWDFPKGLLDPGETPLQAAQRELLEEAGLGEVHFPWGKDFIETEPYGAQGKIARYYLGEVKTRQVVLGINPELGRPEHQEYRWLTYDEAQKIVVPRLSRVLDWAQKNLK